MIPDKINCRNHLSLIEIFRKMYNLWLSEAFLCRNTAEIDLYSGLIMAQIRFLLTDVYFLLPDVHSTSNRCLPDI